MILENINNLINESSLKRIGIGTGVGAGTGALIGGLGSISAIRDVIFSLQDDKKNYHYDFNNYWKQLLEISQEKGEDITNYKAHHKLIWDGDDARIVMGKLLEYGADGAIIGAILTSIYLLIKQKKKR
jgi:hypothetical protein